MIAANWFLVGVPWDCSGTARGEQAAPGALRDAGLSALVSRDLGDVPIRIDSTQRDQHSGVLALPETVQAARTLTDALSGMLRKQTDRRPLIIGGDCSILFGIAPALRATQGPIGLWFVDGHPDYLDGQGSITGETADMDLAVLTGNGAQPLLSLAGTPPMVAATDEHLPTSALIRRTDPRRTGRCRAGPDRGASGRDRPAGDPGVSLTEACANICSAVREAVHRPQALPLSDPQPLGRKRGDEAGPYISAA